MLRTISRVRKKPDSAYTHLKVIYGTRKIGIVQKGSSFVGKGTLSEAQLDYAIRCAKEIQAKKTW